VFDKSTPWRENARDKKEMAKKARKMKGKMSLMDEADKNELGVVDQIREA